MSVETRKDLKLQLGGPSLNHKARTWSCVGHVNLRRSTVQEIAVLRCGQSPGDGASSAVGLLTH